MSDLATIEPGFPAHVTATTLTFDAGLPVDRWGKCLHTLGELTRASRWWIGDAIAYGESHYGEKAAQYLDRIGLAPQTLLNLAWVSRRVEPSRRRESLSWSHHEVVAALDPVAQASWLAQAEAAAQQGLPWTVATMRRALRAVDPPALEAGRVALPVIGDRLAEAVLALAACKLEAEPALWNAACGLAMEWQCRRQDS